MKGIKRGVFVVLASLTTTYIWAMNPNENKTDSVHRLTEVVIKASRAGLSQNQAPISLSVIKQKQFQTLGITSTSDISMFVPNLVIHTYGSKLTNPIFIRGIGSKIGDPTVAMYVDGVPYYTKALMNTELYDISSIEVLRGPQGTEYGVNTMGGLINISTISPLQYQGLRVKASVATYNQQQVSGGFYSRPTNKFAFSINGNLLKQGGFFTNAYTHKKADPLTSWSVRNKMIYLLGERGKISNVFQYQKSNQGGYPYAPFDTQTRKWAGVNYNDYSSYGLNLLTDALVGEYTGDTYVFKSVSSFLHYTDAQKIDQDFTPAPTAFVTQNNNQSQFNQDLNLRWTPSENLNVVFGTVGYYHKSRSATNIRMMVPMGPNPTQLAKIITTKDYNSYDYGLSGLYQTTIKNIFIDRLTVTAGMRFDYSMQHLNYSDNKNVGGHTVANTPNTVYTIPEFIDIMPKLAIGYGLGTHNIYATVTRGYQNGGFNTAFETKDQIKYKPEYSWNYEIGLKSEWLNHLLHTDVSLFYIDWTQQHIAKYLFKKGLMITNAGHTFSRGAEFDFQLRPIGGFSLMGSYGFTDARYIKNKVSFQTINPKTRQPITIAPVYNGKYIPYVPRHTMSLSASQAFNLNNNILHRITFTATAKGMGKIYYNDANTQYQNFYTTFDLRIGLDLPYCNLTLWGTNITNQKYTVYQFFGFDKKTLAQMGRPTQLGVTLSFHIDK